MSGRNPPSYSRASGTNREPEIPFPFDRTLENAVDDERFMLFGDDPPSGHIIVSGEPMAFWLPGDKTPAGIGLNTTEQGK